MTSSALGRASGQAHGFGLGQGLLRNQAFGDIVNDFRVPLYLTDLGAVGVLFCFFFVDFLVHFFVGVFFVGVDGRAGRGQGNPQNGIGT